MVSEPGIFDNPFGFSDDAASSAADKAEETVAAAEDKAEETVSAVEEAVTEAADAPAAVETAEIPAAEKPQGSAEDTEFITAKLKRVLGYSVTEFEAYDGSDGRSASEKAESASGAPAGEPDKRPEQERKPVTGPGPRPEGGRITESGRELPADREAPAAGKSPAGNEKGNVRSFSDMKSSLEAIRRKLGNKK